MRHFCVLQRYVAMRNVQRLEKELVNWLAKSEDIHPVRVGGVSNSVREKLWLLGVRVEVDFWAYQYASK